MLRVPRANTPLQPRGSSSRRPPPAASGCWAASSTSPGSLLHRISPRVDSLKNRDGLVDFNDGNCSELEEWPPGRMRLQEGRRRICPYNGDATRSVRECVVRFEFVTRRRFPICEQIERPFVLGGHRRRRLGVACRAHDESRKTTPRGQKDREAAAGSDPGSTAESGPLAWCTAARQARASSRRIRSRNTRCRGTAPETVRPLASTTPELENPFAA
jgi:hypothetical protein